jgi:hypothetical protein
MKKRRSRGIHLSGLAGFETNSDTGDGKRARGQGGKQQFGCCTEKEEGSLLIWACS